MSITAFVRTARLRQQVFRDESGTVSDEGRNPRDEKGLRNPHLLTLGHEEENLYPGIRGTGRSRRVLRTAENQVVEEFKKRG